MATPWSRTAPAHPDCLLPHHQEGARVRIQRWSNALAAMENIVGTVVAHRADHRVIVIATEVGELTSSCGWVGPA